LIDYFDTCIIVLLLFDAFYNKRIYKYDDSNIIAFSIFVIIIILNLCFNFHFISQENYFNIYKILLIVGAIFVGLLKLEKYKK
jgi:L-asparagine transporter-like permease